MESEDEFAYTYASFFKEEPDLTTNKSAIKKIDNDVDTTTTTTTTNDEDYDAAITKATVAADSDTIIINIFSKSEKNNNLNVNANGCDEIKKTIYKNNNGTNVAILSELEKLDNSSNTIKSYNTVRNRIKKKCNNELPTFIDGYGLSDSKIYTTVTHDTTHSTTRNSTQINHSNDVNAHDDEGLLFEDGINNSTTIHHKDNFRKSDQHHTHNRKSLIHSNNSNTRFSRNTSDKMMQKRKYEYNSTSESCNDDDNDDENYNVRKNTTTTTMVIEKTPKKSVKLKKPSKRRKNDTALNVGCGGGDDDTDDNESNEFCDNIVKNTKTPSSSSSSSPPSRSMHDHIIDNSLISVISLKDLKRKDRSLAEHCNILTIHSPKLMLKIKEENQAFYKALLSTTPVEMVRKAGQNCVQFGNMEYLEWCELVLLQLCNLKKPLVLENTWRSVCEYVNENMWCLELKKTLEQYQPSSTTLMSILHRNRRVKKDRGYIVGDEAFKTRPLVNYEILSKYKLGGNIHDVYIHSKTKFNFNSASVKYSI